MRLDELSAAAERVLATLSPSERGVDDDAIALATFVRDLLSEQPTIGWIERTWHCSEDEDYQVVSIGEGDPFDLVTARRLAADLLRAAEQAEVSASRAVLPAGEEASDVE